MKVIIKEQPVKRFYGLKKAFFVNDLNGNKIASAFLKKEHAEEFVSSNGWKVVN